MEQRIDNFLFQYEQPEPTKFKWPLVLFGELFTTRRHLGSLLGYLATMGWEGWIPDLREASNSSPSDLNLEGGAELARKSLEALARELIVIGHGLGGLMALKLASEPYVKAAVAIAPLAPGFSSPLYASAKTLFGLRKSTLAPPKKKVLLDMMVGVEPGLFEPLAARLVPEPSALVDDIEHNRIELPKADRSAPRLIIAGQDDLISPPDRLRELASEIGAQFRAIDRRGHWLIGGRALERAASEAHRFLVRSLGEELLLLFPEEWKTPSEKPE